MRDARKLLKKEGKLSEFFFLPNTTLSNVRNFKLFRSQGSPCCQITTTTKNSWRHFSTKLNSKTQTEKVWKAVRKIKGKDGSKSVNHLKVTGKLITDKNEVAEALAINLLKNILDR